jgi:hypothetical protein
MSIENIRIILPELIRELYSLPGCGCGGLCHIITDDYNTEDSDIKFVISEYNKPENSDRIDKDLGLLICNYLMQINDQFDRFKAMTGMIETVNGIEVKINQ